MDGFILFDKPCGLSSNHALQNLKRLKGYEKVGHTGTLDPFATGLLVIGVDQALKFIPYLQEEPKVYQARLCLGKKTDTLDLEGQVIDEQPIPQLTSEAIEKEFQSLMGSHLQIPPMYSAKKQEGVPLYKLARKGVEVSRKPVPVTIDELTLLHWEHPFIDLKVSCSKGTYVRVLGEEIAQALKTVGHLVSLRRLRAGPFILGKDEFFSIPQALAHYPLLELTDEETRRIKQGKVLENRWQQMGLHLLFAQGQFIGLGMLEKNQLKAERLLSTQS